MVDQYFPLLLKGISNTSIYPIVTSLGTDITHLEPNEKTEVDFLTPNKSHAFRILMAQYNLALVFNISKTANQLHVTESVGGGSATLDITGLGGQFRVEVQDAHAIAIEDISESYVLQHKGGSFRRYRFVVEDSFIDVRPYN